MNRTAALLAALGAALGLAALGPVTGPPAATARTLPGTIPAGTNRVAEHEAPLALEPAPIADRDTAGDQLRYAQQAAALPLASSRKWQNVGPLGQDDPTNYPTGAIRFARSAGMGAAIAVDPRDPSGSSVYVGNMGGLWHSKDGGAHWTNLTDGKVARAAVGAIAVDPKRPTDLYVGTGIGYITISGDSPGSGVYVSHDAGRTFSRPAKNVRGYATNAITVTPYGVAVGTSNGLYYSTDRGASFTRVPLKTNATHTAPATGAYANWISAIAVNPLNAHEVTAAVGFANGKKLDPQGQPMSPGNGLYRSTSGVAGPYTYLASSALLRHPAASADPIGRIMLSYAVSAGDHAVLWAIVSDAGLANRQQPAGLDLIGTTTGKSINATNTQLNGLYRSDDDGATWQVKATPQSLSASVNEGLGIYPALGYGVGVQATYNLWVQADPRNPDQVFFGLEEVFQSVANTGSGQGLGDFEIIQRYWDVCGSTTYLENLYKGQSCPDATPYYGGVSTHPDQHVGVVTRTAKGIRLYTGNDGGFFHEDSAAESGGRDAFDNKRWVEMNTLATVQPWHVARKPDGEYLTALQDNGGGFFAPGQTNKLVSSGDGVLTWATHDPDTWYLSAQGAVLYVTRDHGKDIREIQPDLSGAGFLSPIVMDPTDENHLVAAGTDVQESLKGPDTQTILDPLLYTVVKTDWTSSFDAGASPTKVNGTALNWTSQALAVRGAAVYDGVCALCRNSLGDPTLITTGVATNVKPGCTAKKGSSDCWHLAAGKGLPHVAIWNMAIDPSDVKTVYVVLNENSLVGLDPKVVGAARVMVSHDAGEHFSDITGNLPHSNARDVVLRDGKLIVATDHGVFTAPRTGGKWARLGLGLPAVRIYDLSLDPQGRHLTVSAYGRGVWDLDFGATAPSSSGGGPTGQPVFGSHGPTSGQGSGSGNGSGSGLASTGGRPALAVLAGLLLLAALAVRRFAGRRA